MTAKFNRPNNGVTVMRSGHKPLRTTAELAAEFGVSAQSLARFLLTSEIKPMMTKRSNGSVKGTWYAPAEVRTWWKQRSAA